MPFYLRSTAFIALTMGAMALATSAQTTPLPAAAPSAASPAPAPQPSAAGVPENPLVTARVNAEFLAWQRGRISRSTYSPQAGGLYIDALINVVSPDLQAIGAPQTTTYRSASLLLGDLVYRYDITGANGAVSVLYALDQSGKTDGIVFTPLIFRPATGPSPATMTSPVPAPTP